jgi:hypothetical protein
MTTGTRKSGQMIGLLVVVGVFALWLGMTWYYAFGLNHGTLGAFEITFPWVWWPAFAFILGKWLYSKWHRERVLMDCGPLPDRWISTMCLVMYAVVVPIKIFLPEHGPEGMFTLPICLSFCVMFVIQWLTQRVQITERGVQWQGVLVRWEDIAAWSLTRGGTLKICAKGRFQMKRSLWIAVPQREAVEELLTQYCAMDDAA